MSLDTFELVDTLPAVQLSVNQMLIEMFIKWQSSAEQLSLLEMCCLRCRSRVDRKSIKGFDRHLTTVAFIYMYIILGITSPLNTLQLVQRVISRVVICCNM